MTNLYRQLLDILPADPLTVATVAAVHADGTVTVTFPGGSQQRVRGAGSIDSKVFVRKGQVDGPAPDLVSITIEV